MHCVDLGESFQTHSYSNAYLLAKFSLDTAENEPCQVCPTPRNAAAIRQDATAVLKRLDQDLGIRVEKEHERSKQHLVHNLWSRSRAERSRFSPSFSPFRANFRRLVLGCIEAKFCK